MYLTLLRPLLHDCALSAVRQRTAMLWTDLYKQASQRFDARRPQISSQLYT